MEKDAIRKRIGSRIKTFRAARDMRQAEVSKLTGIAQSNFSEYERGTQTINVVHLFKIAEALGCKPEDLVTDKPMII